MSKSHTALMLEFSEAAKTNSQVELLERKITELEKKTAELQALVDKFYPKQDNALPGSFMKRT